jgi:hypothetical protein
LSSGVGGGDVLAVRPRCLFVVFGVVAQAAVQDADEAVS